MSSPSGQLDPEQQKAEARKLRRQRQTTRNLVASLVASLGIVAFLVFVVARPDTPVRDDVDFVQVAQEAGDSAPAELVVPELDETWSANRADFSPDGGQSAWTLGLISSSGDFVQVIQLFEPVGDLDSYRQDGVVSSATVAGAGTREVEWETSDRSGLADVGNYAFVASSPISGGVLVVRGNSEPAVLFIASTIQRTQPHLFQTEG